MKTTHRLFRRTTLPLLTALLLAPFTACGGDSPQKHAYERAQILEQTYTTETAHAIIAEYRKVVAMAPGASWAKKAEARIAAVTARHRADEQHKDVFHEHGID